MPTDLLGGWGELTAALLVFLLTHVIPSRPQVRARLVALAGQRAYLVAYSLMSLLVLAWLILASANAPFVELWPFEEWQRLIPQAGMLVASLLLVFGLSSPNPASLGRGKGPGFDPARPGIVGVVRHPVLWAALIWSVSHLVPNGDVAHFILFGLFAAFAAAGMLALDRRAARRLGEARWQALASSSSNIPFARMPRGWWLQFDAADAARFGGGILLYAALLFGHPYFTGVTALSP